jgi:pectate lyase
MKFLLSVFAALLLFPNLESIAHAKPAQIAKFSLMRVDKNAAKVLVPDLKSGETFDLAVLPTKLIALKVKSSRAQTVSFTVEGNSAIDNSRVSLTGTLRRDGSIPWSPAAGTYLITALPFNKGVVGEPKSIQLTLNDSSVSPGKSGNNPDDGVTPPPPPPPVKPSDPIPAFVGAEGFGTLTPGGSGRHLASPATTVFRVSSLADSGANTLRACVDATVPRVCIFETSGRITLKTPLVIKSPFITIAGQTAPAPGIMITDASLRVATHDVVIRHVEIRIGDDPSGPNPEQRDGVTVAGTSSARVYNVVLDHISVSWGIDENLGIGLYVSDITISNSIISEALYNSIHPKGPHSKGLLVGDLAQNISIHHNLLAHNQDRNPRIKPGTKTEFISNFVYNWGGGSSGWNEANIADTENTSIPSLLNFIGNHYKVGRDGRPAAPLYADPIATGSRAYVLSNIGPTRTSESQDEWKIASIPTSARAVTPAFPLSGVVPHSGIQTPDYVLSNAGARPKEANSIDIRVKLEAQNGTGTLKDCLIGCSKPAGDFPVKAVINRPLTPPANPNGDDNNNGYTNLEEWLDGFAAAVE